MIKVFAWRRLYGGFGPCITTSNGSQYWNFLRDSWGTEDEAVAALTKFEEQNKISNTCGIGYEFELICIYRF